MCVNTVQLLELVEHRDRGPSLPPRRLIDTLGDTIARRCTWSSGTSGFRSSVSSTNSRMRESAVRAPLRNRSPELASKARIRSGRCRRPILGCFHRHQSDVFHARGLEDDVGVLSGWSCFVSDKGSLRYRVAVVVVTLSLAKFCQCRRRDELCHWSKMRDTVAVPEERLYPSPQNRATDWYSSYLEQRWWFRATVSCITFHNRSMTVERASFQHDRVSLARQWLYAKSSMSSKIQRESPSNQLIMF